MKKLMIAALAALLLCFSHAALAEDTTVVLNADIGSISVDRNTEYVDLGRLVLNRQGNDYNSLVNFLRQLPNVKKVDMFNSEVYRTQVDLLAGAFPNIEFGWTILIPCNNPLHPERTPHRVRTDQTAFSTLHNNQCTMHTNAELDVLRYCKALKALDIGHNGLENLNFLYDLPQLKVLIVGKNNLTDITPIGSLTELEYLELFSNKVRDISPLANCTHLVDLNMANNRVESYAPLMNLQSLRRLFIYNSSSATNNGPESWSVVGSLKSSLPNCTIDNATGGAHEAWRTGPRYQTITEMFSITPIGTTYIPFTTLD